MLVENIEIMANEDSKSTIVIQYETEENLECYHNGILRVNAKKGAKVKIIFVNLIHNLT